MAARARSADVILSQNEAVSLVGRAARGAGYPARQAQEFGAAAGYLAATKGPVSLITTALQETPAPPEVFWTATGVDITQGACILIAPVVRDAFGMGLDHAGFPQVDHGPIIAAFLTLDGISLTWDGCRISRSDTEVISAPPGPVDLPDDDLAIWRSLAAKTYVPESDGSRQSGAGSTLSDND